MAQTKKGADNAPTKNQPTAAEMREWYDKNWKRLNGFDKAKPNNCSFPVFDFFHAQTGSFSNLTVLPIRCFRFPDFIRPKFRQCLFNTDNIYYVLT